MPKYNSLTDEEQAEYLKNTYGISRIKLFETIQHWCPLGDQVGTTQYEIEVIPGNQLAELCKLHSELTKLIKTTYSLESGLQIILSIVKEAYLDAKYIKITAKCPPNKHMACEAEIEWKNPQK